MPTTVERRRTARAVSIAVGALIAACASPYVLLRFALLPWAFAPAGGELAAEVGVRAEQLAATLDANGAADLHAVEGVVPGLAFQLDYLAPPRSPSRVWVRAAAESGGFDEQAVHEFCFLLSREGSGPFAVAPVSPCPRASPLRELRAYADAVLARAPDWMPPADSSFTLMPVGRSETAHGHLVRFTADVSAYDPGAPTACLQVVFAPPADVGKVWEATRGFC